MCSSVTACLHQIHEALSFDSGKTLTNQPSEHQALQNKVLEDVTSMVTVTKIKISSKAVSIKIHVKSLRVRD